MPCGQEPILAQTQQGHWWRIPMLPSGRQQGSRASSPVESPSPTPPAAPSSGPQPSPEAGHGVWHAPHSVLAGGHTAGDPARGYARSLPEAPIAGRTLPMSAVAGPLAAPHTAHVPGALQCVAPVWPGCIAPDADTACSPCGQNAPPMSSHSWDRCVGARRYSACPSGR
jgi:hypothetical protein